MIPALPEPIGTNNKTTTMWWNQIKIGGVSMRDAVTAWWNGSDTSKTVHKDCVWNGSSTGGPVWPGAGTPPGNPDGRMPWCLLQKTYICMTPRPIKLPVSGPIHDTHVPRSRYTSKYNCNPTCWGNPFCAHASHLLRILWTISSGDLICLSVAAD